MFDHQVLTEFTKKLQSAKSVLLLLPPNPDTDSLAASLSLYLTLKQVGKKAHIGCSSDPLVQDSHLFGISDIKKHIGTRNLVISFDYKEDSVEHVSYDVDEETSRFLLVIKPKPGVQPISTENIEYSYTGADAELTITFGITALEELGKLYSDEKTFLDQSPKYNLTLNPQKLEFDGTNLLSKGLNLSESVAKLMRQARLNPTADAATNLYQQIQKDGQQFEHPKVSADTFEIIAYLLRAGAKKATKEPSYNPPPFFQEQPIPVFEPEPQPQKQVSLPKPPVPKDWQTPKIFRSGGTIK